MSEGEPEFDPRSCGSCGVFPVKRLEVICAACRSINPEPIKPIVIRVMDEIEKGEAA